MDERIRPLPHHDTCNRIGADTAPVAVDVRAAEGDENVSSPAAKSNRCQLKHRLKTRRWFFAVMSNRSAKVLPLRCAPWD